MLASGLSTLELRSIVEGAFLPMRCTCTVTPGHSMIVQIVDPASSRVDPLVTTISLDRIKSSRDISNLVAELRDEMLHGAPSHAQSQYRIA